MRRPLLIAFLVALAAALGVLVWTRPPRSRRPRVTRLVAWLVVTQLGAWWNPGSWFSSLGHIASSALRDIENWCKDAINYALSLYDEAAQLAQSVISETFDDIYSWGKQAYSWAEDAADWIGQAAGTVGGWVQGALGDFWQDVVDPALHLVESGVDTLGDWAHNAVSGIESAYDAFVANVFEPVAHWVEGAEDWLQARLASWWDQLWKVTFGPVWSTVVWLVDNVPQWIDWLVHTAFDIVTTAGKCLDWLVFFGEHPTAGFEDLAAELENAISGGWVSNVAKGSPSIAAGLEQDFVRLMGY